MDSLYSRYASALLDLAKEDNKVTIYKDEIKMLKDEFIKNEQILHLLSSYQISVEEKEQIIDAIYPSIPHIKNFIKVVVRNKRIKQIIKIFDEFIELTNFELGIKEGIVYSINKLDNAQMKDLETALSNKLNVKVELLNVIDERLIGGVKIVIEDKVYDGSVKNKLEKLKESLSNGGL